MKISELIEKLADLEAQHGDIEIYAYDENADIGPLYGNGYLYRPEQLEGKDGALILA